MDSARVRMTTRRARPFRGIPSRRPLASARDARPGRGRPDCRARRRPGMIGVEPINSSTNQQIAVLPASSRQERSTMDGARFDAFSREVASRRSALRAVGALALAAFAVARVQSEIAARGCKADGKPCRSGVDCCFGVCKHRVCKCPRNRRFAECPEPSTSEACTEPTPGVCCDPAEPPVCSGAKNQACISGWCCDAVCCAPDRLCGDTCCADTQVCIDGQCCPGFRSCGATCCPQGQHCVNGACVQCDSTCPSGGGGGVRLRWPR